MTLTVDLSEDTLARLRGRGRAARRQHRRRDRRAGRNASSETASEERKLSFIGLGASTSGRHARDADDLLADGFGRD